MPFFKCDKVYEQKITKLQKLGLIMLNKIRLIFFSFTPMNRNCFQFHGNKRNISFVYFTQLMYFSTSYLERFQIIRMFSSHIDSFAFCQFHLNNLTSLGWLSVEKSETMLNGPKTRRTVAFIHCNRLQRSIFCAGRLIGNNAIDQVEEFDLGIWNWVIRKQWIGTYGMFLNFLVLRCSLSGTGVNTLHYSGFWNKIMKKYYW